MYVIRFPARSRISDRWGRLDEFSESVENLSEVFRTVMPVAATTGSTMAAASTPAMPAIKIRRPTALVLLDIKSAICTQ
jgi:hypothetical protein